MSQTRRTFLTLNAAAVAAGALGADAEADAAPAGSLIDVNVYLSRWPSRRLPGDEPAELAARLRARGVVEAWAGSFDALLHRDLAAANARLAAECRRQAAVRLVPFGSVNPRLPDWEDDLRRCRDEHAMPGIRLHPNYHGYALDDPECLRLLELAAGRGLIVQVALTMEDERTQHPLLQVPHVDAGPLVAVARRFPNLQLMLLNAFQKYRTISLKALAEPPNISFEIAMLEGVGGVAGLIERVGAGRVLFGSYAPFYYFESAALKLRESPLEPAALDAVRSGNARRLGRA